MRTLVTTKALLAGLLGALCATGFPAIAQANSFAGLAVVVAVMAVGLPCAVIQVGLIIGALFFGRKSALVTPARRRFAKISMALSLLLILLFVATALVLEGDASSDFLVFTAGAALPLVVLGSISALLSWRILKRGGPPTEGRLL